jgi:hypothetical protein
MFHGSPFGFLVKNICLIGTLYCHQFRNLAVIEVNCCLKGIMIVPVISLISTSARCSRVPEVIAEVDLFSDDTALHLRLVLFT